MLLVKTPYFYSAFITLECATPLSVKADEADLTLDSRIVRDVNGYPIIPGTSIAGVLRSVARQCNTKGETLEKQLFGFSGENDDLPSQIQVSFGFVHNGQNKIALGLDLDSINSQAEVDVCLKDLMPIIRDQVSLNEFGAAQKGSKMDRTAVPKGTRFSFELNWATDQQNDEQWHTILAWVSHPEFRLGGLTHRGFGKVKVISIKTQAYNFKADGLAKWQQNRAFDFNAQNGQVHQQEVTATEDYIDFKLDLQAEDFWRIGQGDKALPGQYDKEPDIKPYTEKVILWDLGNNPKLTEKPQVVIPASGIKGALRHRTLFHYRRLMKDFSDGLTKEQDAQQQNADLAALFGDISGEQSQIGSLILDDIYLTETPPTKVMMHNKIDRFTGGTIDGALFSEQLLYGGGFVLAGKIKKSEQSQEVLQAFKLALLDLAEGRLALGGGSTKGHGYFEAVNAQLDDLSSYIQNASPQIAKSEAQSA
jgi:CRISPR/Cas system CSM-associated protein Csm3 (group 7 of RAMP superfamily)